MACSLERTRTRTQLLNSSNNDRAGSLVLSSKSNEHSPRHQTPLLTPTNHEQSKRRQKKKYFFLNICF